MFTNALISINWSRTGVDAAALARSVCTDDARLTLAHVHADVPLSPDVLAIHLRKAEMRHSMRALKGAAFATQIESTQSVGAPSVGDGLSGLVSMIGADLVVSGPVDHPGEVVAELSGWWTRRPASVPFAIAIAAEGFAARSSGLRRIGVIDDGSRGSQNILAAARQLADRTASRLKVLEVAPAATRSPGARQSAIAAQRLTDFSSRVDLLVGSAWDRTLGDRAQSSLLLINHPMLIPSTVRPPFGTWAEPVPAPHGRMR